MRAGTNLWYDVITITHSDTGTTNSEVPTVTDAESFLFAPFLRSAGRQRPNYYRRRSSRAPLAVCVVAVGVGRSALSLKTFFDSMAYWLFTAGGGTTGPSLAFVIG